MKQKGFTLLEMIVVVMIIAVLFLLTIPNISGVIGVVDDKACDALTRVVDSAAVQYRLKYGQLPNSVRDLVAAGFLSEEQMSCSNGKTVYFSDGHAVHD